MTDVKVADRSEFHCVSDRHPVAVPEEWHRERRCPVVLIVERQYCDKLSFASDAAQEAGEAEACGRFRGFDEATVYVLGFHGYVRLLQLCQFFEVLRLQQRLRLALGAIAGLRRALRPSRRR